MDSIQHIKQIISEEGLWNDELFFNRWEYIKNANSIDTNLYFIEKGCVRVYFLEDSHEHALYFGYEGSLVSDLNSFFSESKSSLIIQCINKTKVKVISKARFNDFIQNHPSNSQLWIDVLSELSLWHLERQKDLLINSPSERFNRTLLRQPLLFQKVPHKYIASYLRMTPESFSRLQKS